MRAIVPILLVAGAAFIVYAVATQYTNTDPTQTVPKRVWASIVAGAGAIGAAAAAFVSQWSGQ